MTRPLNHHETSDTYVGELFRAGDHRVAVCRDGIQWLFQRQRSGKTGGASKWDTLGYYTTRAALHRDWTRKFGSAPAPLLALPEQVARGVR